MNTDNTGLNGNFSRGFFCSFQIPVIVAHPAYLFFSREPSALIRG